MKILMVLTSHEVLGNTGRKTGFWLEEFAVPYFVFRDAGVQLTLASPKGGQPPLDPKSDLPENQTPAMTRFKQDQAAQKALSQTVKLGDDFFADKDVCSIVLEVPNAALGSGKMGLWHRALDGASGKWVQADRGALASQSVFLPGDEKAAYQLAQPADDARFIAVFAHSLEHTGGYTPEAARRAAGILLPDILPYDPSKPASYPVNGRKLNDDAVDVFLSILTNGKVTRDNVGPHTDLLASFPYVGAPHKARSAHVVAA